VQDQQLNFTTVWIVARLLTQSWVDCSWILYIFICAFHFVHLYIFYMCTFLHLYISFCTFHLYISFCTFCSWILYILYISFEMYIFPDVWKLPKIIPIPKPNKDLTEGGSYRPISLLSPITKTLEKVILPYITSNIPQVNHQHGFKTSHSTTTALHQLTNQIIQGFNHKLPPERAIVVSLDKAFTSKAFTGKAFTSKAFDTVNIHLLIKRSFIKQRFQTS